MNRRSTMEHTIPNGIPPQFAKDIKPSPSTTPPLNGVDSLHSSRNSSPGSRVQQIPASQLPPTRNAQYSSNLPKIDGADIRQTIQGVNNLNISPQVTPFSSPREPPPQTSTPIVRTIAGSNGPSLVPTQTNNNATSTPHPTRTFSATQFTNVAVNSHQNLNNDRLTSLYASGQNTSRPLHETKNASDFNHVSLGAAEPKTMPTTQSLFQPVAPKTMAPTLLSDAMSKPLPQLGNAVPSAVKSPHSTEFNDIPLGPAAVSQFKSEIAPHSFKSPSPQPKPQQSLSGIPLDLADIPQSKPLLVSQAFSSIPDNSKQQNSFPPQASPYSNAPLRPAQAVFKPVQAVQQQRAPLLSTGGSQVAAAPPPVNAFSLGNSARPPANPYQNANGPMTEIRTPQPLAGLPNTNYSGQKSEFPQNFKTPPPQAFPRSPLNGADNHRNQQPHAMPQTTAKLPPNVPWAPGGIPPPQPLQSTPSFPTGFPTQAQQAPPTSAQSSQNLKTNLHTNRYPQYPSTAKAQPYQPLPAQQNYQQQNQNYMYGNQMQGQAARYNQGNEYNYQQQSVTQAGFSKMWGHENFDLLQCPNILPSTKLDSPRVSLGHEHLDAANCSLDIFRCTMTKIPESSSLLQKSRLPLGVLIHPFKDLDHLPVIQCANIVRCRACRTYINPFIMFVDNKRWKCNLCYRVNELPEEFQYDPVTKTYGDPTRRPEVKSSTIEYIAPSEYMLRPPQPAVYLFLLDVSHAAIESGYLNVICNVLASNLSELPGDARTQIGFIAYNSAVHFFSLAEGISQPHQMTILDVDDIFLPCPDNLLVNLQERFDLVTDLLAQLPTKFCKDYDKGSALGAALQAAHKMISMTGGRITVFQSSLPSYGPGTLSPREDPNQRAGVDIQHLNPANDFYKRLALECSGQQIAVDLFVVNSQYADIATISGISRFSGGCIYHFPLFKASRPLQAESLERSFKRYLTRKIGFEAVMRLRCTRGLSIHTFHGNFFVRSTDLLSLPNVNPDAGFGMQVAIDESLTDVQNVCFQAALLYTSSKGERRIRVHTLCLPVVSALHDVIHSADQQCIVALLAKMAVDRCMQSSLPDAREAFINVAIDILSSYKLSLNLGSPAGGLLAPQCLKLLPLYISALLKYTAFRTGSSTRLDDRVKAMCDMKTLPLFLLVQNIYPDLYAVHNLDEQCTDLSVDGENIPQPPRLQLTARSLDSRGAYLMDSGEQMSLLICSGVSQTFLNEVLGVPNYNAISDQMYDLPILDNQHNRRLNSFISYLNEEKPVAAALQIMRDDSPNRGIFIERLIEDRMESALSYHEFLQHLKTQVK